MAKIKDEDYRYALEKDITPQFYEQGKIISMTEQNLVLSGYGKQGSGKSRVILDAGATLSYYTGKEITIDNIHFTLSDLNKNLATLKPKSSVFLDERVKTAGYGSMIEQMIFKNAEQTLRKKGINFFMSCPEFIRHDFHFYFETWEMGAIKKWDFNKPIHEQWKYTRSILYDRKDYKIGYIVTGNPPDKELLKAYEQKKDAFLEDIQKGRGSGRFGFYDEKARKMINDEDFIINFKMAKAKKLRRVLLIEYLRGELLSTAEIDMIIEKIDYLINFDKEMREKFIKTVQGRITAKNINSDE